MCAGTSDRIRRRHFAEQVRQIAAPTTSDPYVKQNTGLDAGDPSLLGSQALPLIVPTFICPLRVVSRREGDTTHSRTWRLLSFCTSSNSCTWKSH